MPEHLVVTEPDSPSEGGGPDLVLSIDPVRGQLGSVRGQVSRFLHQSGVDDDDWPLVANELVANAVDASPGPGGPPIRLAVEVGRGRVQLTVTNAGPPFELPRPGHRPEPGQSRGRGLGLVGALVDGIEVHRADGLNVTTCWKAR